MAVVNALLTTCGVVSFAAVLVILPFSVFFLAFPAPFRRGMGPKRPKRKNENGRMTRMAAKETTCGDKSLLCHQPSQYSRNLFLGEYLLYLLSPRSSQTICQWMEINNLQVWISAILCVLTGNDATVRRTPCSRSVQIWRSIGSSSCWRHFE